MLVLLPACQVRTRTMTVNIEKNAHPSESDYMIPLLLASWLRSFLCPPGGVIIIYIYATECQFAVVFPHISGSQLSIAGVSSLVLL